MRSKTHKDVEFHTGAGNYVNHTNDFEEAAADAIKLAAAGHDDVELDVIIWSRSGARWWGGDDAVEQYDEDPEASVFERFQVKVNAMGRVP